MIQRQDYPNGGFVLHRVELAGSAGRFSAWYDAAGKLLDAEQFDRLDRPRTVRPGPTWDRLERLGKPRAAK